MNAREQTAGRTYRNASHVRVQPTPPRGKIVEVRPLALGEAPRAVAAPSFRRAAKRALDLAIAIPALAVAAPALALIAILVRLDSHGPAFFRQKRTGLGGRTFEIVKFRTLTVMENGADVVQVRDGDARLTRVGRWLRKTSLDELPQLFNVLSGEMSLVGPRPHAVAHDRHYAALIEEYAQRWRVKPGITGWAQVNGLRGATPTLDVMRARIRHDVWYARHQSFLLDLRILARTPREILRQRNAV